MSTPRPNVLFITADQWRGDCLSGRGHPIVRTPHIDGLARSGVTFRRHFAQAAPCGPSRASLYTGTYLHVHRSVINGAPLDGRFTNVALEARKAGYRPALFGYTDTAADPTELDPDDPRLRTYEGVLPGFDAVCPLTEEFEPWAQGLRDRGFPIGHERLAAFAPASDPQGRPCTMFHADDSETAFLTHAAIDWIKGQAQPWFAHVSYFRPHPPFVAPAPYHALYDPARIGLPNRTAIAAETAARHPFLAWALGRAVNRAPADGDAMRQMMAAYYGLIAQVDDAVAEFIYALRDNGQIDNTIIVFTSDHGEMMGDHWLRGKLGFYDAAFHVPLVIVDPRPPANRSRGSAVDGFTESVDLLPTLADLLGWPVPDQAQGRSLAPWIAGGHPADWREAVHWEYDFRDPETRSAERHFGLPPEKCNLAVRRDDRGKYVHFAGLPPLFFDLTRDPGETIDRIGDPDYLGSVARYAQRLLDWRQSSDDRGLTRWKLVDGGPFRSP